jgi:adenosylcobinamide kinase/adenosylcobinamide-phosphate guanylyltransferase
MLGSLYKSEFPQLSVVLGGARSGKSRFAEGLARASGLSRTYIATAEIWDSEMRSRITQHIADRGEDWTTVEAPLDLTGAIAGAQGVILIDCATLWLTNQMLADADLGVVSAELLHSLATSSHPVIIVTNEVGAGIVPDNALARRFRDAQGRLNQQLAAQAHLVVAVMAGLPLVLKGALPLDATL